MHHSNKQCMFLLYETAYINRIQNLLRYSKETAETLLNRIATFSVL